MPMKKSPPPCKVAIGRGALAEAPGSKRSVDEEQPVARGFDVVVVGSGFGGAVTACRLAQAERACSCWNEAVVGPRSIIPVAPAMPGSSIMAGPQSITVGSTFVSSRGWPWPRVPVSAADRSATRVSSWKPTPSGSRNAGPPRSPETSSSPITTGFARCLPCSQFPRGSTRGAIG